jgi:hypothetical protein
MHRVYESWNQAEAWSTVDQRLGWHQAQSSWVLPWYTQEAEDGAWGANRWSQWAAGRPNRADNEGQRQWVVVLVGGHAWDTKTRN